MTKQNDEKKKKFERPNYPSDRFDSLSLKINRTNEETLSAMEEGRKIAVERALDFVEDHAMDVMWVLFDEKTKAIYDEALAAAMK